MTTKAWKRFPLPVRCGSCWGVISKGEPVLEYELLASESRRRLMRCTACAGERVPADLLPLVESVSAVTPRMKRTGEIALPFDFKRAQSGEREPGMEG